MKRTRSPSPSSLRTPSTSKTCSLNPILLPIRMMLALPISSMVLPPLVEVGRRVKDPIVQAALLENVATRLGLSEVEKTLVHAIDKVLEDELEDISVFCVDSRVTDSQIEAHSREIGTAEPLKPHTQGGVRRFVQFMLLLERMQVVWFEGKLSGRTLLGCEAVVVRNMGKWHSVLKEVCTVGYFSGFIALYDYWLMFGWCAARKGHAFPRPKGVIFKQPTEKKIAVLLYNSKWKYSVDTLNRNVKRYTNGHTMDRNVKRHLSEMQEVERTRIVAMLLDAARVAS